MKNIKSYFMFSSGHRNGIFILILFIVLFQVIILNFDVISSNLFSNQQDENSDKDWLVYQKQIDSLKLLSVKKENVIYPFNPNYITDYKGYMLGMSVEEIDRLHRFRKEGKFINSVSEFKNVTKVSDSLLKVISPYFKFPEWVTKKNKAKRENHQFLEQKKIVKKNINLASKEDLMEVYGIGDKLSDIILRDKEKFGEFATIEQLRYVWGINEETFEKIKERFFVEFSSNGLKKIKVNEASTKELLQFPYFNYAIAKEIVTFRSMNGGVKSSEDLSKIKDFPVDKIEIIILYLEIN